MAVTGDAGKTTQNLRCKNVVLSWSFCFVAAAERRLLWITKNWGMICSRWWEALRTSASLPTVQRGFALNSATARK